MFGLLTFSRSLAAVCKRYCLTQVYYLYLYAMFGAGGEQIVAQGASAGDREVTPASTAAAAAAVADKQKQLQENATAAASASSGSAAVATTAEDKTKSASELTAGSAVAAAVPGAAVVVPPVAAAASAAAAAAADAKPKKQREITAEELRALESLTSPSSVSKEKAQLAQMKATLSESMQSAKDGIKQVRCATQYCSACRVLISSARNVSVTVDKHSTQLLIRSAMLQAC
jgi:hypothetical protein